MCTIILILVTTTWLYPWGFSNIHHCTQLPCTTAHLPCSVQCDGWQGSEEQVLVFCTVEVRERLPSLCSFYCIAYLVLDNPCEPWCWSSTSEPLSHSPHTTQHPAATIAISKNLLWSSIFKRQAPQNCSVLTKTTTIYSEAWEHDGNVSIAWILWFHICTCTIKLCTGDWK